MPFQLWNVVTNSSRLADDTGDAGRRQIAYSPAPLPQLRSRQVEARRCLGFRVYGLERTLPQLRSRQVEPRSSDPSPGVRARHIMINPTSTE